MAVPQELMADSLTVRRSAGPLSLTDHRRVGLNWSTFDDFSSPVGGTGRASRPSTTAKTLYLLLSRRGGASHERRRDRDARLTSMRFAKGRSEEHAALC